MQTTNTGVYSIPVRGTKVTTDVSEYNLHFDTPPPEGAIITADYTTRTIAKTSDYVFDFELVITLAEKTV